MSQPSQIPGGCLQGYGELLKYLKTFMAYKTGPSKSLDDITLEDVLQYPIWEWALDEEGVDGQDETWQRPIIDTDNVTDEIFNPTITVKVKGTDFYGSGEYDNKTQTLSAISIWNKDHWDILDEIKISVPIIIISVPKIDGQENIEFKLTSISDDAASRL
jgi:hypothetical protein